MSVISEIKIKSLPDEYQQVEYIESTGTQWINTGVLPTVSNNRKPIINFKYKWSELNKEEVLFGSISGNLYFQFYKTASTDENTAPEVGMHIYSPTKTIFTADTEWHSVEINVEDKKAIFDDEESTLNYSNNHYSVNQPISLFGRNVNGAMSLYSKARISYWEYNDGTQHIKLLPCYRKSDGIAGMYDLIHKVFHTNKGTGVFIVGADYEKNITKYNNETIREIVHDGKIIEGLPADKYHFARQNEFVALPSDYQQVEYIETTDHKAYIDTGVAGSLDIDFELSFQNMVASTGAGDTSTYILQASSGIQLIRVHSRDSFNKVVPIYIIQDARNHLEITAGYSSSKLTIKKSEKNFYANGVLKGITSFDIPEMASNFYYCSHPNDKNNNNAVYRHWGLKMWSDGELIRNYIPCYRKEDKVVGWFDLVGGTFNKSLGTSEFVAGADVNIELENAVNEPLIDMQIKGNSIQANLPVEYQQVEYIESTGTQYVDTGCIPKTTTKAELQLSFNGTFKPGDSPGFIGAVEDTNSFTANFGAFGPYQIYVWVDKTYESGATAYRTIVDDTILNNKNVLSIESGTFKYSTEKRTVATKTENHKNFSLVLFGTNTNGVATPFSAYNMRLYGCKIYENEELLRDLIPCYRKSDNVAGLYDLVESKFYTNAGTGVFIVGENIVPSPEVPIEIQSVGDYDEETGKYKIPITTNETTTNIYLNEPLRKVGDYIDVIDYKNNKVVRYVEVLDDSGTQSIENSYRGLEVPIEETIEVPEISTFDGTNTFDIEITIKPSEIKINYWKQI